MGLFFMTHDQWDFIADAVNPVLLIVFLAFSGVVFAGRMRAAWPFAIRFWVALLLTWVLAQMDRWIPGLRGQEGFPSGHMTFYLTVATAFALLRWQSAWVTVPVAVLYGWLIVFLDYHSWWDLFTALTLAVPITLVMFWRGAGAEQGRFPFLTGRDFLSR
jgi:membrane-associated phospholipid phosphatase